VQTVSPTADQRGQLRPVGLGADIGSFEAPGFLVIAGKVIDTDGTSLTNIEVTLSYPVSIPTNRTITITNVTDTNGFEFSGLVGYGTNLQYTVRLADTNTPVDPPFTNIFLTNSSLRTVQFLLGNNIGGYVTKPAGTNFVPVAGITITITNATTHYSRTTATDSGGHYFFNRLADGTYTIIPTQNGLGITPLNQEVTVPPSQTTVNFLSKSETILGHINPATSGITIELTGTTEDDVPVDTNTTTKADGSFEFRNLAPGTYTVTPQPPNDVTEFAPPSRDNIIVPGSADDLQFAIFNITTLTISGHVRKPNGTTGLPGVTISLSGPIDSSTTTLSNGSFIFTNIPPGDYTVTPAQTEFGIIPETGTYTIGPSVIDADFNEGAPQTISGSLTFLNAGIPAISVDILNSTAGTNYAVLTGSNGTFTVTNLGIGDYIVIPAQVGSGTSPAQTNFNIATSLTTITYTNSFNFQAPTILDGGVTIDPTNSTVTMRAVSAPLQPHHWQSSTNLITWTNNPPESFLSDSNGLLEITNSVDLSLPIQVFRVGAP
jgi:hypothetical protein